MELLVVIAIISILMGLLLPSVQGARESGRRLQCKTRMRELGLGIRAHETSKRYLPPMGTVSKVPVSNGYPKPLIDLRSGTQFSWIVLILPYIEQENLHSSFDFSETVFDQPTTTDPQATHLSILQCPSDSAQGRYFMDSSLTRGRRLAKGNYAAFTGPYHTDNCHLFPGALCHEPRSTALIRDGLSNTLMVSEVRTRESLQDQRGAWAVSWNASTLLSFDMHTSLKPGTGGENWDAPYKASARSLGFTQTPNQYGGLNFDILYLCPDEAGSQIDGMPCGKWPNSFWLSAPPRSNHPGGVNVVFLDGHTGFLPDGVDEFAMAYMISADEGTDVTVTDHTY